MKRIIGTILITVLLCGMAGIAYAQTWQETLEKAGFDIVDTFDHYQDWAGKSNNGGCSNLGACDLPVLEDGSKGKWDMYDDYSAANGCSGPQSGDYWITNYGSQYQWRGKALRMSYTDPLIYPAKQYDYRIDFNSGGIYQPQIGDTIVGQTSYATAKITGIIKYPDRGSWATGDALGEFYVTNKTGTFQNGENVTINNSPDSAVLASPELEGFTECTERLGPNRMGMYFGDGTPESGYDNIYLFFMVKFQEGSIKYLPQVSRYGWIGTWKFYELEQGFVNVMDWEETEDRNRTCNCAQDRSAYGLNFLITNIGGGGFSYPNSAYRSSLFLTAGYDDGDASTGYSSFCGADNCWTYKRDKYDSKDSAVFPASNFISEYEKGNWIGMEIRWYIGTLNNDDAEYEEWYYNENGDVIAHNQKTGLRAKREFNNKINKLVLGGNRFAQTYGLQEGDVPNGSFYIDDVIIDGQRIGPVYFGLLKHKSNFGDINNDGTVNVLDVQLCVNVVLGISPPFAASPLPNWAWDADKDGKIDGDDMDEMEAVIVERAKTAANPLDECNVLDIQAVVNEILGG